MTILSSVALSPAAYDGTLRLTRIAIALWCSLSSLEAMVTGAAFAPGGVRGRDITALGRGVRARLRASPLASAAGLRLLPGLRLAAGIALAFATTPGVAMPLLVVVIACTAAIAIVGAGSDGADKIATVACMAALSIAAGRSLADPWLCLAGVAWAAGQLTIAYCTSGAAKLASPFWRDGTGIAAAMTSYTSGHAVPAFLVRHRVVARALAWAVILPEVLFPAALPAPAPVCVAVLAGFALFHVATAFAMGLNTYPWAFIATYPCVLMANDILHRLTEVAH